MASIKVMVYSMGAEIIPTGNNSDIVMVGKLADASANIPRVEINYLLASA